MGGRPRHSIGARVRLLDALTSGKASEFSIIARHFLDTAEPRYRICNLANGHERTVREEDIVIADDAMSRETELSSKIVPFRRNG